MQKKNDGAKTTSPHCLIRVRLKIGPKMLIVDHNFPHDNCQKLGLNPQCLNKPIRLCLKNGGFNPHSYSWSSLLENDNLVRMKWVPFSPNFSDKSRLETQVPYLAGDDPFEHCTGRDLPWHNSSSIFRQSSGNHIGLFQKWTMCLQVMAAMAL